MELKKAFFSKLSAQILIINPNILNVIDVINRKKIMSAGCAIFKSIKNEDVIIIRVPSKIDLLAVACKPTNPTIISIADIGAACNSNMVPLNFGYLNQ